MIRYLGIALVALAGFAVFFVGTETYRLQDSIAGNAVLGLAAGMCLAAILRIWRS